MRDMRHLVGVILAIVMAAVLFFAASWGYLKLGGVGSGQARLGALPAGGNSFLWSDRAGLGGFGAPRRGSPRLPPDCPGWSCSPGPACTCRPRAARSSTSR